MQSLSSNIYATWVKAHLTYISITVLAIQHLFLVHLFLRLYNLQQKDIRKTNLL